MGQKRGVNTAVLTMVGGTIAINPLTILGETRSNRADGVDLYISNVSSNDMFFCAGADSTGIIIPPGQCLPLANMDPTDGAFKLVGTGTDSANVTVVASPNPAV